MPVTDTYIEKEAMINEEIERLRHATTQALLTRQDCIIVASVSCIYGLGSPIEYEKVNMRIEVGQAISRNDFARKLIDIFYKRTNADLTPGEFRALGNTVEIMPVSEKIVYRIEFAGNNIEHITIIDAITRSVYEDNVPSFFLFPAKHFVTPENEIKRAIKSIKEELADRLAVLEKEGKILEAERLKRRTNYDLAMIKEVGYTNGIENYSRHFDNRAPGEPPYTLLSYFPHKSDGSPDFLTIIDESHVTIPQLGGMYAGDQSRKQNLVDHGFRLPSARDNRPLNFEEVEERLGQRIYTSATPGEYEKEHSKDPAGQARLSAPEGLVDGGQVVEQVIRPTGLIDPPIFVRGVVESGPYKGQIQDFIKETVEVVKGDGRVIATTLTKKMAEDLSEYLKEKKIKAEYLHSDIKTIERIEILTDFRRGKFDCLVGVNLLREGLDLPEVEFIGILDADKEGFLRSETSLIQIIGRAARNIKGRVVLYADNITGSMERAIGETNRRRDIQIAYNKKHNITPKTIIKKIADITEHMKSDHDKAVAADLKRDEKIYKKNPEKLIRIKEKQMNASVKILDFETAALLRDEITVIMQKLKQEEKESNKVIKQEKERSQKRNTL